MQSYRETIAVSLTSPEVLVQSARGLILLPPPHRDLTVAKTLLDTALAMQPDYVFGHHIMAHYYEKIKVSIPKS